MKVYLVWCKKAKRFVRVKDAVGEPAMLFWSEYDACKWAMNFWKRTAVIQLEDDCEIRPYTLNN